MTALMKAVECKAYGPPSVLKVSMRPIPIPKANQLLIKVHATALTPGDCEMRSFKMHPTMYPLLRLALGFTKPRNPVLGMYFSGTVVQTGSDAQRHSIGDEVFGCTGFAMGTNAEYLKVADSACIITKPSSLTHIEAAAVPIGALNALHFCNKANFKKSERLLIVGAGGAIGTFAIQLAKLQGVHVTAIDSDIKLDMLRRIGADEVIDYTVTDFTGGLEKYDVIFDVVGRSPYSRSLTCLTTGGRYILANVGFTPMLRGLWTTLISDKRVITAMAAEKQAELEEIRELIEAGKLRPVIDRVFTLEQIPDAHRYIDSGLRQGNTVASFVD
jgi:2-desacetyl-2-hydroxyethyl bacteriochlorophyllide A dehydrogenase